MSRTTNQTLNLPDSLPRWTVPLVLLSTLALEAWDVWSAHTTPPPLDLWACATMCDHADRVVGTYTTTSCTCVLR